VSLDLVIFDVLVPPAGIELLNSKTPGFKEIYKEEVRCFKFSINITFNSEALG